MEPTTEKTLKALIAVAWADGRVGDEEKEVIETLLDAYGLEQGQADDIRKWAATRRTLEQLDLQGLEEVDRILLLQQAVFVTYIDGVQTDEELELLRGLAKRLGLENSRATELIKTTTARAKARYEEERAAPTSS
jgi:tellurite resistance protein